MTDKKRTSLKDQVASAFRFKAGTSQYLQPKDEFYFAPDDDQFLICDPVDPTRCIRFDAGTVATGTTAVVDPVKVGVMDLTTAVYATPTVLTAADSGKRIYCNVSSGMDITLPAIATGDIGMEFRFLVGTTIATNNLRITAQTGDLLQGGLWTPDFDAVYTAPQGFFDEPNGSSHLVFTANGTTTGGKRGTQITYTAMTATAWFVSGINVGDGVQATAFS